jgi:uncharacterized Tic20 family protein
VAKSKTKPEVDQAANEDLKAEEAKSEELSFQETPPPAEEAPPQPLPPPVPPAAPLPEPLSASDERTWAMLAHLSVLANLVTGILGPVIAIIIYLVFQDRSRYVAYHAMQAFIFQLIWWVGGGALAAAAWTISGILSAIIIGCCLMPFALLISLIPLGALIYGSIGAIQTGQGQDFKYWLIGDWVRGILEGV